MVDSLHVKPVVDHKFGARADHVAVGGAEGGGEFFAEVGGSVAGFGVGGGGEDSAGLFGDAGEEGGVF